MKLPALARFLCLLLLAGSPALAEELTFEPENFAISKPEGWMEIPEARVGPVVMSMANPDRTGAVVVFIKESPSKYVAFDEKFAVGFDKGFDASSGGKKISGKFSTFQGLPAYERFGTLPVAGQEGSAFARVIMADGNFFMVQGVDLTGNVADNAVIMKAVDSFRFLRPVEPPSRASMLGRAFGEHGFVIVVVTIVATLIVLGLASVASLFKKKKPRQPGEPPPLR